MEWNRNTDRDSSEKETLLLAEAMPKIDLHCHLDGSIEPFLIREKMEKLGMKMTAEEVMQRVGVDDSCRSLAEYLEKFDLPIRCIQDADFLNEAAYYLGRHAHSENVVYLEVRYAPQICLTRGMTLHDSISSVIDGLERAHRQYGIGYGVICCAMRHLPMEQNRQMLEEGSRWLGKGVVACDLAGDENAFPNAMFGEYFDCCREAGMPMTIHAGETGSRENVRYAVEHGARRIGHGIAMSGDEELMRLCADQKIGVEMCPTSNFQTKACTLWEEYPLKEFMAHHIPVSVNTDNRTCSSTDSTREFKKCVEHLKLNKEDLKQIYLNSVEMSFASEEQKFMLRHSWV